MEFHKVVCTKRTTKVSNKMVDSYIYNEKCCQFTFLMISTKKVFIKYMNKSIDFVYITI